MNDFVCWRNQTQHEAPTGTARSNLSLLFPLPQNSFANPEAPYAIVLVCSGCCHRRPQTAARKDDFSPFRRLATQDLGAGRLGVRRGLSSWFTDSCPHPESSRGDGGFLLLAGFIYLCSGYDHSRTVCRCGFGLFSASLSCQFDVSTFRVEVWGL